MALRPSFFYVTSYPCLACARLSPCPTVVDIIYIYIGIRASQTPATQHTQRRGVRCLRTHHTTDRQKDMVHDDDMNWGNETEAAITIPGCPFFAKTMEARRDTRADFQEGHCRRGRQSVCTDVSAHQRLASPLVAPHTCTIKQPGSLPTDVRTWSLYVIDCVTQGPRHCSILTAAQATKTTTVTTTIIATNQTLGQVRTSAIPTRSHASLPLSAHHPRTKLKLSTANPR
jgi:hypothetical protein